MKTEAWYKGQHKYSKSEKGKATSRRTYFKNRDRICKHRREYSITKKAKILANIQSKKYRLLNKNKIICRRRIGYLIQKNYLKRDICAICGMENAEFHHFNYDLPYYGIWLCKNHYSKIHRKCW